MCVRVLVYANLFSIQCEDFKQWNSQLHTSFEKNHHVLTRVILLDSKTMGRETLPNCCQPRVRKTNMAAER